MSDTPAGWQPDPRGRHEYRYWDGTQWTDHVSDKGQVSTDPVADTSAPGDEQKSQIFSAEPAATSTAGSAGPPSASAPQVDPTAEHDEPAPADPEPVPTSTPPASPDETPAAATASSVPSGSSTGSSAPAASSTPPAGTSTAPAGAQSDAKAAAQEVMHSRSPELGTILSAVVPGSGHFYLGSSKVPLAAGLLAATIAAVVISHFSFLMFLIGFVVWLAAAAFALTDLRGGVRGIEDTSLPRNVIGILLIGAGALLVISLLLPYYRVSAEVSGFGVSQSVTEMGSGFEAFDLEDIILLIVGIAAIVAGAASLGLGPLTSAELPRQLPLAVAIGGAIATVIILFRMFVDPVPEVPGGLAGAGVETDVSVGRAFGIWLGLWASLILLIANAGVLRSLSNRSRTTT